MERTISPEAFNEAMRALVLAALYGLGYTNEIPDDIIVQDNKIIYVDEDGFFVQYKTGKSESSGYTPIPENPEPLDELILRPLIKHLSKVYHLKPVRKRQL